MHRLRSSIVRFLNLFRRGRLDADLKSQLEAHRAMVCEDLVSRGVDPKDAELESRKMMGNRMRVRELSSEARTFRLLDDLDHDIRHGLRALGRSPGFAIAAVLTLALGIGANATMFSVINSVLLRPLPYDSPDGIVRTAQTGTGPEADNLPESDSTLAVDDFRLLRDEVRAFSRLALYQPTVFTWTGGEFPQRITGARVSPGLFELLGTAPQAGRLFEPREESQAYSDIVILSDSFWRRYFSADLGVLGSLMTLGGRPHTVVGVLPAAFEFPDSGTELWTPFQIRAGAGPRDGRKVPALMRLADGISLEEAEAEVNVVLGEALRQFARGQDGFRLSVVKLQDDMISPVRMALIAFGLAAGLVLVIAWANVAHMLLVRTVDREREMAVRLAVGALPSRLVRQILSESVLLAMVSGGFALLIALAMVKFVASAGSAQIPRLSEITIDAPVIGFVILLSFAVGVCVALASAIRLVACSKTSSLRRLERPSGPKALRRLGLDKVRSFLMLSQVALTVVLLVNAGLLLNSFRNLSSVDPGYSTDNVLTFFLSLSPARYTHETALDLNFELLSEIESLPGVRSAGINANIPLEPFDMNIRFLVDDQPEPRSMEEARQTPSADFHTVSSNYLETLGVRLIDGEPLPNVPPMDPEIKVLVNETLARWYFPDGAIGHRIRTGIWDVDESWDVIGVVGDIRQQGLDQAPVPEMYINYTQVPNLSFAPGRYFVVKTAGPPTDLVPTLRRVAARLDSEAVIDNVLPLEQRLSASITRPRFYAGTFGIFAFVALVVAGTGIYGVTAYSASQRTREIGIRIALGARQDQMLRMVIRHSALITTVGLFVGLFGAATLARYVESLLFELTSLDPATFIGATLLFLLIAAIAAYLPANRASRSDPIMALRHE